MFYEIVVKLLGVDIGTGVGSGSQDSFHITRPYLNLDLNLENTDIRSINTFLPKSELELEFGSGLGSVVAIPLKYHAMYHAIEALRHLYTPSAMSLCIISDSDPGSDSSFPNLFEAILALLLSPERLFIYHLGSKQGTCTNVNRTGTGLGLDMAVVYTRCGSLLGVDAAQHQPLPPVVHITLVKILNCAGEGSKNVLEAIHRLEMLRKRTTGHYVS